MCFCETLRPDGKQWSGSLLRRYFLRSKASGLPILAMSVVLSMTDCVPITKALINCSFTRHYSFKRMCEYMLTSVDYNLRSVNSIPNFLLLRLNRRIKIEKRIFNVYIYCGASVVVDYATFGMERRSQKARKQELVLINWKEWAWTYVTSKLKNLEIDLMISNHLTHALIQGCGSEAVIFEKYIYRKRCLVFCVLMLMASIWIF